MTSLAESYEIIGRILAKTILGGLRRQELEAKDVMPDANTEKRYHFADVVSWLHAEGLIISQGAYVGGGYLGVQLTSKGIAAIETGTFNGASGSIRQAVEAKPEGSLGAETYGKIGSFVGGLLGGFAQSAQ
ncbi:hypothetical protein GCM10010869_00930 [Mesorhizobium tianshanense]|nr:hypothetical protein [Mesorhizobium tianshanense]GLS34505.1 hypothetical protein GCM10010869_00930 [Mesorhizobium tianshanense]